MPHEKYFICHSSEAQNFLYISNEKNLFFEM